MASFTKTVQNTTNSEKDESERTLYPHKSGYTFRMSVQRKKINTCTEKKRE